MAQYLVLARKYRSMTFDEVVGQHAISTTLKNAIATGRIAQGYLFTGTRGVGKTTMARILAKALNCLNSDQPTDSPCNKCDACVAISRGEDMDVIEIDGASNRGIDEIRELIDNASLVPSRCRYRIFYIDEVHMLTREAFNALLKTLEEPPSHVKFIFATTEPNKIPATILSRCQRFDFRNISTADIAEHMTKICTAEKIDIEPTAIHRVARAAAGSMRDGLSLLDQLISSAGAKALNESDVLEILGCPSDQRTMELTAAIAQSDPAKALVTLDEILAAGFPVESVAASLAEQFRFIMLTLVCGAQSELIDLPEDARKQIATLSGGFTVPAAVQAVSMCEQLMRNLRGAMGSRALAEATLVRLAAADKFVDVTSLTQRLQQLASNNPQTRPAGPKKKALNIATNAAAPAASSATTDNNNCRQSQPAVSLAASQIQWQSDWLRSNWQRMVKAVAQSGFGLESGLLGLSRPASFFDGTLELHIAADQLPRVTSPNWSGRLSKAFSQYSQRDITLKFTASEEMQQAKSASMSQARATSVTTADFNRATDDPTVKAIMEAFDAKISTINKKTAQPETTDQAEDETEDR